MMLRFLVVVLIAVVSSMAFAQPEPTYSGEVEGWPGGEADLVLLSPENFPPPFVRPPGVEAAGRVAPDGTFALTVPLTFPDEGFVPVADFLDAGCSDAAITPEGASYVPVAIVAYDSDDALVGEIFQASPGSGRGPTPGGYSVVYGYSTEEFSLRGTCPDSRRSVVEDYDFEVQAGWHAVVQRFEEDPERTGWRIDRWRNEPVPEDAVWVMISP